MILMYLNVQIISKTSQLKQNWKLINHSMLWGRKTLFIIKTYYKHYDMDRKWNGIWAIKIMRVAHSHILRLNKIPTTGKHDLAYISLIAINIIGYFIILKWHLIKIYRELYTILASKYDTIRFLLNLNKMATQYKC